MATIPQPVSKKVGWNLWELVEPYNYVSELVAPDFYSDHELTITPVDAGTLLEATPPTRWNKVTGGPNFRGTDASTLFHDQIAVIWRCKAIAKAWGWSEKAVIRWSDQLFHEMNVRAGVWKPAKRFYRYVLRQVGWQFYRVRHFWWRLGGSKQGEAPKLPEGEIYGAGKDLTDTPPITPP